MRKLFLPGVLVLVLALSGCASFKEYDTYSKDMWKGKKAPGRRGVQACIRRLLRRIQGHA